MTCVMPCQILKQGAVPLLAGEEEEAEEVEQREGGEDAHVGFGGGDGLREEGWVGGEETGSEEAVGGVCCGEVAGEEKGKDAA